MKRCFLAVVFAVLLFVYCSLPKYHGEPLWTFEAKGRICSSALGQDGTIYFTMNYKDTASLYALNPDGDIKWKYTSISTKDTLRSFDFLSIRSDGTIYVGGESVLFALNPDGSLLWSYEDVCQVGGMLIGTEGALYILDSGILIALNESGEKLWESDLDIILLGCISADGSVYVYESSLSSPIENAVSLYPDGTLKWRRDCTIGFPCPYPSPAVGEDGTIYDAQMYLMAISDNGDCLWNYKDCFNPSIGSDESIYAVGYYNNAKKNKVIAFDDSGKVAWEYKIPGEKRTVGYISPVVGADGTIYVGECFYFFWGWTPEEDYYLYALDNTGRLLWTYSIDGFLSNPPLLAQDGTLYLCTNSSLESDGANSKVKITALQTESMGLASSSWPRAGHDNQNTGRASGH